MVRIRLTRTGHKNHPIYRIVATDRRSPRDGRFIEILGFYSPLEPQLAKIDSARYNYWVKQGAQPSDRVAHLFKEIHP